MHNRASAPLLIWLVFSSTLSAQSHVTRIEPASDGLLATERVSGDVWMDPRFESMQQALVNVVVWFDEQFLGDGKAYRRRADEFKDARRSQLRENVTRTLKAASERSFEAARQQLDALVENKTIVDLRQHWIVNGFSCSISPKDVSKLTEVKGVSKVFAARPPRTMTRRARRLNATGVKRADFEPEKYKHPWYIRYLLADKVWSQLGVTGKGTLNVIQDFNFTGVDNVTVNLYRNPKDEPGNRRDDDGNGLVDDAHGFNFDQGNASLTMVPTSPGVINPSVLHGTLCAAIISGAGIEGKPYEFGIAPESRWAGVIASGHLEHAIEWAVEQNADTYSMSFSIPGLGEYRSHWRKVMEHGSFCGIYFVSGAGNFAQNQPVPVQMRTPEDIPDVVFAAAGVQRNFGRTPFSSKGPVRWETEHYQDGEVAKPEVCAFNMGLPLLLPDGTVRNGGLNGNSFAGPMFCGAIALMVSADPDLLPWDLKNIITSTATDVAAEGVDFETGHGLINCYRAVKEVLRRKAVREGTSAERFEGRQDGDEVDIATLQRKLRDTKYVVGVLQPGRQADQKGLKPGDVFVSYNGDPIRNVQQMRAAKSKAERAKLRSIKVVYERDGQRNEVEFQPGALGFVPAIEFDDPTFQ